MRVAALAWALGALVAGEAIADERPLDLHRMGLVPGETSKVNYYKLVDGPDGAYVHAEYQPGLGSMKRGINVTDFERRNYHKLRWRWRVLQLPVGGDECGPEEKQDCAASLYLGWRSGLRWYSVKYAWPTVTPKGKLCNKMRNPFVAAETVILESGGPTGEWRTETVDTDQVFREHFAGGDPKADVPDFIGFMILTDGDQTNSVASADYGGFTLLSDRP